MPHEDSHRHRARRPRTVEHRLAGGHHRNTDTDGCLATAIVAATGALGVITLAAATAAGYLT